MFQISAKARDNKTGRKALRDAGDMPAVFYGLGKATTSISVPLGEFKKVWHKAGESSAVKLSLGTENVDVLIHDVQMDPVSDEPIHADFLVIDMTKKIRVHVPIEFTGISDAVKNGLGSLVKVLHELEVEALPANLPHSLSADISKLATLEDVVLVSDVSLPAGVTVMNNPSDVVASVVAQKEEKEEVAPVDLSAIEVEKKGKKEEEGVEGEAKAE